MSKFIYIDDLIIDFFHNIEKIQISKADESTMISFATMALADKEFTQNQANYALKILKTYMAAMKRVGVDYSENLENLSFKKAFRVIDYSKEVFVEKDQENKLWICLKFPFQLKKIFENEISNRLDYDASVWDPERKIRKIDLYQTNLIQIFEFCQYHEFKIDESFMILFGQVEEIWQQQDQIIPSFSVINQEIIFKNCSDSVIDYYKKSMSDSMNDNLLLAKSMGLCLKGRPTSVLEKICSVEETNFYMSSLSEFLKLSFSLKGKTCLILDRADDLLQWAKSFSKLVDNLQIDRNKIKFCYRADKNDDTGLNDWIKSNGFGGSIDSGTFFIFIHKPAKWLFKNLEDVKIIATTSLYPATNHTTKLLLNTHNCVIHVGEFKPSQLRESKIVKL